MLRTRVLALLRPSTSTASTTARAFSTTSHRLTAPPTSNTTPNTVPRKTPVPEANNPADMAPKTTPMTGSGSGTPSPGATSTTESSGTVGNSSNPIMSTLESANRTVGAGLAKAIDGTGVLFCL